MVAGMRISLIASRNQMQKQGEKENTEVYKLGRQRSMRVPALDPSLQYFCHGNCAWPQLTLMVCTLPFLPTVNDTCWRSHLNMQAESVTPCAKSEKRILRSAPCEQRLQSLPSQPCHRWRDTATYPRPHAGVLPCLMLVRCWHARQSLLQSHCRYHDISPHLGEGIRHREWNQQRRSSPVSLLSR